jgi:hypothetical protein
MSVHFGCHDVSSLTSQELTFLEAIEGHRLTQSSLRRRRSDALK